jgi:hypothetical protein
VRTKCVGKTCVGLWGYYWGARELLGVDGPGLKWARPRGGGSLQLVLEPTLAVSRARAVAVA